MPNPFDQGGSQQPQQQQFEDKTGEEFLADFVGEDKKYKSVEEMARALAHANHHIGTLEGETATLREKTAQAKTIEDVMAQLASQQQPAGSNTDSDDQSQQSKPEDVDVEATVKRLFEQHTSTATANANKQSVIDALSKQFGTKAGEVWDTVEKQFGIDLEQMASTSPTAALQLLGASGGTQQQQQSGASLQSTTQPTRDSEQRPPEGSKRLVDYMLSKGEITRKAAYDMKLKFSADPTKYKA